MNILVVNYRDRKHPAAGGAEKHLHLIFSKIVSWGHRVVLFTTSFPGAPARETVDGIEVVREGGDLLFQLTVARRLRALDREFQFDVVCEDLNKLPLFTPWILKKPVLVQMHHLWSNSIYSETSFVVATAVWFFERLIPWFYGKNHFVVVSPSTREELVELGISKDRVSVIYNGSEPQEVPPQTVIEDSPYFLWLSRVHRYKGIWTALSAFELFAAENYDLKLKIAGDGPLLKKIPRWLEKHRLQDRVELCGFVPSERKRELMAGAVALLQTSYKEGWGLTVMEAAQLEVPTIASDVPGLRDSVRDLETGVLFPVGDAEACSMAMARMVQDWSFRNALGAAARRYARGFSWERSAQQTLNLLTSLVSKPEDNPV